jgi:hypothetical protein
VTTLSARSRVKYGQSVRRPLVLLLVLACGLGAGATALAQGGGDDELSVTMQRGCLSGTRVSLRITPADGQVLSPVHVRVSGTEIVHLTGVTQEASVLVRLPSKRGRVSISGETTGGRRFSSSRDYRPCAPPAPSTPQRNPRPEPTLSGGGEG